MTGVTSAVRREGFNMHHQPHIKADRASNIRPFKTTSKHVAIVVQDAGSAYAVTACEELFALANRFSTDVQYNVDIVEDFAQAFETGAEFSDRTVILFGSVETPWLINAQDARKLRTHLPCVQRVGFVGSAVLAAADIPPYRSHKYCVHMEFSQAANELQLHSDDTRATSLRDRNVYSATGKLAAAHMVIEMITVDCGEYLAEQVQSCVGLAAAHANTRTDTENHYIRLAHGDQTVSRAIAIMKDHIEDPLRIEDFYKLLPVSSRQLQRSFMKYFNETPLTVYRNIRLERANQLLKFTDLPIREVAIATGFSCGSLFSKQFQRRYFLHPIRCRELRYARPAAANEPAENAQDCKRTLSAL